MADRPRGGIGRIVWSSLAVVLAAVCLCPDAGVQARDVTGSGSDKTPILLVYGFQPIPGFYAPALWTEFVEEFSGHSTRDVERLVIDGGHAVYRQQAAGPEYRDVYISDYSIRYEPTVRDLRLYASRLAEEMAWIRQRFGVTSFVIVGHSMGGLIARCIIEAQDFIPLLGTEDFPDYGTVYQGDVAALFMLSTPNHGVDFTMGSWFSVMSRQLTPESRFLDSLNSGDAADPSGTSVPYVSLAGQSCFGCGLRIDGQTCRKQCIDEALAWEGSDLVVRMSSAFLPGAENIACIGFDHVDMHTSPLLVTAISRILQGQTTSETVFASAELAALGGSSATTH